MNTRVVAAHDDLIAAKARFIAVKVFPMAIEVGLVRT